MRFTEIEHKFVLDGAFDLAGFRQALAALGPQRQHSLRVRDRYFLTDDGRARRYLLRHRFDRELHQLTIKSLSSDPEVRDEISLDLGRHAGDQAVEVEAFVGRMGVAWRGELQKDLDVWYFPDCEIVHYVAASGGRVVRCVEFEAVTQASIPAALAVIDRYEQATGFDPAARSRQSLVDLLFPGVLG
ncbi:MAG TPA: CYTH domain-containing protein [Vicinamibacterales bacterium]|nr:CYTH domain-containing protein [Vicinamibacterales bacterium]